MGEIISASNGTSRCEYMAHGHNMSFAKRRLTGRAGLMIGLVRRFENVRWAV